MAAFPLAVSILMATPGWPTNYAAPGCLPAGGQCAGGDRRLAGGPNLADGFSIQALHADLDALARQYVPLLQQFPSGYRWSLMQVEYSWDLSWKRADDLAAVDTEISRQAILTVKRRTLPSSWATTHSPSRTDQRLPHPDRRHPDQALAGTGLAQTL